MIFDGLFAPRFYPGTLEHRRAHIKTVALPKEAVITYHPQRRALSRNLRKCRGRDPRSSDRIFKIQPVKCGRAELTSDMIVVVEEMCDGVTRQVYPPPQSSPQTIDGRDDKRPQREETV